MSQPVLESLPPDLLHLLESERSRPDPSEAMRSRVMQQIAQHLLDVPLHDQPALPHGPASGDPTADGAGSAMATVGKHALARHLSKAVVLLVAGGMGGAGLHAWLRPAKAPTENPRRVQSTPTEVEPTPSVPVVAPPNGVDSAPKEKAKPPVRPKRPASSEAKAVEVPSAPEPGPQREPDQMLAAERALLEEARTALVRGKPRETLAVLARSSREFPQGRLMEEREGLVILALAADGQKAAATESAQRFRAKFPRSLLLRAIDAALTPNR